MCSPVEHNVSPVEHNVCLYLNSFIYECPNVLFGYFSATEENRKRNSGNRRISTNDLYLLFILSACLLPLNFVWN